MRTDASSPAPVAGTAGRRRFLVVTGMPRSGTTGVGSALGHAPGAAYLYEPLNPLSGLRSVHEYFLFAGADGPDPVLERQLRQVLRIDLRIRRGIWSSDPWWRRAVKTVTGSRSRASAIRCRLDPRIRTVLWKDPFASFLVPTLRDDYGLPCVVTVRPPHAAAASFKRLGWGFDLDRVHAHLSELVPGAAFLEQGPEWSRWREDSAVNGALLWRLVYGYLDLVLPLHDEPGVPPVIWANSRRLLESPLETYREMYDALGLELTASAREQIELAYRDEGSTELSTTRAHDSKRNVQNANAYWARTLTEDEQALVSALTDEVRVSLERRTGPLG